MVLFILNIHESRHQFWNVNLFELLSLEDVNRLFGALVEKDGGVLEHGLVPPNFILNLRNFLERFFVLLLVDVVYDNGIIPLNDLCILDTLVNFAVALQHLENGLDILAVFRLVQELSETLQLLPVLLVHFLLLFFI